MNGWKSRKAILTTALEIFLGFYLWFKCAPEHVYFVLGAMVALAVGYSATNAWLGRAFKK
jgi:hypothetical protein